MRRFDLRVHLPGFVTYFSRDIMWRLDKTDRVVYLTFDDGPIPELTPWVLEILREENIRATFFCVGENVMKYPWVYQSILDEGHSVGNHTFNHWQGMRHGNKQYLSNIEKAGQYIQSDLFRPPYGLLKYSQYRRLKQKYRIVMWDVISCDYDAGISPEKVFRNVIDFVRPGSIITFHDSIKAEKNLKESLSRSIRWMKEQGYRFEAIPFKKLIDNRQ